MERAEVLNKLTPVFRNAFSNESLELSNELTANEVEQWSSLTHILLITDVENKFAIKFKLKELNKMHNVGEMIDLIMAKL